MAAYKSERKYEGYKYNVIIDIEARTIGLYDNSGDLIDCKKIVPPNTKKGIIKLYDDDLIANDIHITKNDLKEMINYIDQELL